MEQNRLKGLAYSTQFDIAGSLWLISFSPSHSAGFMLKKRTYAAESIMKLLL